MQLSTAGGAASIRRRRQTAVLPTLIETVAVIAAIALLLPLFERIADSAPGRDRRFADSEFRVAGLPEPILPRVCVSHGATADAALAQALCGGVELQGAAPDPIRVPLPLDDAVSRAARAFAAPVEAAQVRLDALRAQQRDGGADLRDVADSMAAIEAEAGPFIARWRIASDAAGPVPLLCASEWLRGALAARRSGAAADAAAERRGRANAVLLLGAAVDGRMPVGSDTVALPAPGPRPPARCTEAPTALLAASAALMDAARRADVDARKDAAMLALLGSAGPQWATALLLGFGFVVWSRHRPAAGWGVGAALALWTLLAWLGRVPWPFVAHRAFEPGRLDEALWSRPAAHVVALGAVAAGVLLLTAVRAPRARRAAPVAQTMSSRIGYPGLVLATGLGALLLLDLSANGHAANRYMALYHQGHLWLGMLVLSVLTFLRQPLAHGLGWLLAVGGEAARAASRRIGRPGAVLALLLGTLAALVAFGLALAHMRQLTSELGRLWLIVGAAWFFFLRGTPLAERLARGGGVARSLWRYGWPLVFVVAVLIAAMLLTRDMGPLLIAGYAAGAFLAASLATWWQRRSGQARAGSVLAVVLFAAWIGAITLALFRLGPVDGVTAVRLESLAAPFASTNDQLALVTWFQRATPDDGFGLGAVPWCGYGAAGRCDGVPAQIHSDYTFTAIVGVFGATAAWAAALGCAVWLHRLIRHHGRVTRGEPRFVAGPGRVGHDGQAFLSWLALAWVVLTLCQLAITVAGNLAVLPLTGVTFPFVSFGMTSLVVNLAFLALCLNVDLPRGPADA